MITVKEIHFKDYPEFTPNLTPKEILKFGFGNTYFRDIYSHVTKKEYKNTYKKYKKYLSRGNQNLPFDEYDKSFNFFGVKVGSTLREWEQHKWIKSYDPYGWMQWYIHFYEGRRIQEYDEWQIQRWKQTAGKNSRFYLRLLNMIEEEGTKKNDFSVSPKIRQTLLHWGVFVI